MPFLVIDRDIAIVCSERAQRDDHDENDEQHGEVKRIKSCEASRLETQIGPPAPHLAPARAIDIGEYKTRKHEKEFDPEITFAHGQVEPLRTAIAMRLAIVEQHEDQRRQSPGAGEGADFRGTGLAHDGCESL